jgi:nucleoside-diphosphate-sugar epimerase
MEYSDVYRNRCILVTGGAGCIGSNLISTLLDAKPARIIVLDDLSASAKWNIPEAPTIAFIKGSVLDKDLLSQVFAEKPDYVFHLAALFANQNSVDHPEDDLMVNGMGTLRVLEASRAAQVRKFIYASSGCSVYGSQAPLPLQEDFVSISLDTPYQITKLLGELYCNFFFNFYGLPLVRTRFFNVYGPGEIPGKYRNVIPNFIYSALLHKPLCVTGTGDETRDFTYVADIVDGVLRAGAIPEAVGEAINLASGTETKVIEIAQIVRAVTGNKTEITFGERRNWDKIVRRRASIEKARRLLGYAPTVDIRKGIETTAPWILKNLDRIAVDGQF